MLGKKDTSKKGKTVVLFDLNEKRKGNTEEEKRHLADFPIIRCAVGEKILCVQRKHPIRLIALMGLPILVAFFILLLPVFISFFLPRSAVFVLGNETLIVYITLTTISALLLIETFSFMSWYYQFYIITNKAIVHRYCFRLVGSYSEVVFGDKMHVQDIERRAPNIIYDFLKIQDVYVYFHKLEREEPFIFKTPDNAQKVEDLLQDLIMESRASREPQYESG